LEQTKIAQEQFKAATARAEDLAWEDYINRVNRAVREIQDDNVALAEDLLHGCPSQRRGWEWHFVKRLANLERLKLEASGSVNSVAFGADGTWIATAWGIPYIGSSPSESASSVVILWDTATGQRRQTLHPFKGCIYSVAASPDGRHVVVDSGYLVPSAEGRVSMWDARTGQLVWSRTEPDLVAMSVTFSPDGRNVAAGFGMYTGNLAGKVKAFDSASGRDTWALAGPVGGVNKVSFHPDGKRLAVAGLGVVEVWDVEGPRRIQELGGYSKWVFSLAFSPDGKRLATVEWDRTVKLWDPSTATEILTIFAHAGFVLDVAISPDSRYVATTSEDRSVRLWELSSGRQVGVFHGHTDFVQCVAFSPDVRQIATGCIDGSVKFWDLRTSRPVVFDKHKGWVQRFAFHRDGRLLSESVCQRAAGEGTLGWDLRTGELDPTLAGAILDDPPPGFEPFPGLDNTGLSEFTTTSRDGKLTAQFSHMSGCGTAARSKDYELAYVAQLADEKP
jgi:WD40 repeat protein